MVVPLARAMFVVPCVYEGAFVFALSLLQVSHIERGENEIAIIVARPTFRVNNRALRTGAPFIGNSGSKDAD